jgi:hypothetical protein
VGTGTDFVVPEGMRCYQRLKGKYVSDRMFCKVGCYEVLIVKKMLTIGLVARMGEMANKQVQKPGRKRPFGRPRLTVKDNLKIDLKQIGYGKPLLARNSVQWQTLIKEVIKFQIQGKKWKIS